MLLVVYNCTDTSDFIIDVGIKALSKTLLAKDHTWYLGISNIGILRNVVLLYVSCRTKKTDLNLVLKVSWSALVVSLEIP